jgi:hypothetical protein
MQGIGDWQLPSGTAGDHISSISLLYTNAFCSAPRLSVAPDKIAQVGPFTVMKLRKNAVAVAGSHQG